MHLKSVSSLVRKFTLIDYLYVNEELESLTVRCLKEANCFFEGFDFYLTKFVSNHLDTIYKSNEENIITNERIHKSIKFLNSSAGDSVVISYSKHKVFYQSMPSQMFLAVSMPNSGVPNTLLANLSSIILEIAIIIARRESRARDRLKVNKGNSDVAINEFETFYSAVTDLFEEDSSRFYSALIFIDFERFSSAKDIVRFSFNNDMLLTILEQLKFGDNGNVFVARVEHDLLALLIKDFTALESFAFEHISKVIQDFRRQLKEQFTIDSQRFFLTFKAGIRLFSRNDFKDIKSERRAKDLIKQTEFAMDMVSKDSKTPYLFFTDELLLQFQRRNLIEIELKNALEQGEFYIEYQPIFNNEKLAIGAEALLRWKSKLLGHVSPNEFIPIAEKSGLVIDIGNFVAEQVCEALSEDFLDINYVSINVSCIQLKDTMYSEKISYLLAKYPKCRGRL